METSTSKQHENSSSYVYKEDTVDLFCSHANYQRITVCWHEVMWCIKAKMQRKTLCQKLRTCSNIAICGNMCFEKVLKCIVFYTSKGKIDDLICPVFPQTAHVF